jgi:predicted RNase H-like nuclease (RuvC/YqgF family)
MSLREQANLNGDNSMSLKDEIKKAVGDHGMWKKTLKNAVDTGEINVQISTIKAENQCSFGKWLYGSTITEKEKNSSHYQEVRELHSAFHEKASEVAQLAISGQKARAMKMLEVNGEFTKASAALTTSMMAWLKKAK